MTSPTILTISSTFFGTSTVVGTIVTTATSGDYVFAYGIAIARSDGDPAWPTMSAITPTPTITPTTTLESILSVPTSQSAVATSTAKAHTGASLDGGAKAGISIAALLGGALLIGFGYLISRWHLQKRAAHHRGAVPEIQMYGKVPESGEGTVPFYEMPTGSR